MKINEIKIKTSDKREVLMFHSENIKIGHVSMTFFSRLISFQLFYKAIPMNLLVFFTHCHIHHFTVAAQLW